MKTAVEFFFLKLEVVIFFIFRFLDQKGVRLRTLFY